MGTSGTTWLEEDIKHDKTTSMCDAVVLDVANLKARLASLCTKLSDQLRPVMIESAAKEGAGVDAAPDAFADPPFFAEIRKEMHALGGRIDYLESIIERISL